MFHNPAKGFSDPISSLQYAGLVYITINLKVSLIRNQNSNNNKN